MIEEVHIANSFGENLVVISHMLADLIRWYMEYQTN